MTYQEVLNNARTCSGPYCKVCPVCNGRACKNVMPGPGSKGTGTVAARNYDAWQDVLLNMDTICENGVVDTRFTLFGQTYDLPVFAGPVGAVKLHYGDKFTDQEYNGILVPACAQAGIAAFTGDGTDPGVFAAASKAIGENGGRGIPTVKPWDRDTVFEKLDQAKATVFADPRISSVNRNKEIIRLVHEQGIFKMKNAVPKVAQELGVSKNTVYLHLRSLKNADQGEEA